MDAIQDIFVDQQRVPHTAKPKTNLGRLQELDIYDAKDKWQLLSKDLAQKTELIHRLMKRMDDIRRDLQEKGNEVLQLRSDIKNLKAENFNYDRRLQKELELEKTPQINEDIEEMIYGDLKNKLLKLV